MSNKYLNLIKDTLIFAVGTVGSKLILFVLVPLYTNYLTPGEYGIADFVFTLSQLMLPFLCLGIYHAVIRFGLSKAENADEVLMGGLVIALIGTVATISITPLVGLYKSISEWKWYFSSYVILSMYLSIFQNYAKSVGKNKTYATVNIVYTIILALLNILFLVYGKMGIRGYLLANVFATLVVVSVYAVICRVFTIGKRAKFKRALIKRMLKYSLPLMVDSTLWWLIQSSNKLFVEVFLDTEILGIYTVAIKIPALMYVIVTIFSQAWGISTVKETEESGDNEFYNNVFKLYTFVVCFACISLVSVIKPFMSIYVSSDYFIAWKYVPLLLVGNAFLAISDFFGAFYNALKMPVKNLIVSTIAASISVLISISMLRYIGLWAAVFSALIAYFTIMWIRLVDIKKYVSVRINWGVFLINQFIILIHAVLVSVNFNILIVSLVAIVLFAIINLKSIKSVFVRIRKKN